MSHDTTAAGARTTPGWRQSWRKRTQVALIAAVGTPLLRVLCATLRVEVTGANPLAFADTRTRPYIVAVWHGRILPGLWIWRRRGIVIVVSENFDGEWIARILSRFGYGTARGSSSRGGARALRQLVRVSRQTPTSFTVDGPRGPARVAQPGIVWLAKATGQPIVPFHAEAARHWTIRSWDRSQIPKPFSRVVMAMGEPLTVSADADAATLETARQTLESRLQDAEHACRQALAFRTPA